MRRTLAAAVVMAAALVLSASPSLAQEHRIGVGYSVLNDGGCSIAQKTLTADYSSNTKSQALRGRIRSAPAGGDCRLESFAYDVRLAHYFDVKAVDATVEFSAARETTAAPYVLADESGAVLLRNDGNALFATTLPAGSAQTVVAAVGVSRRMGPVRLGILANLAPIDWARHADGRTVRLTWDAELRGVYLEGSVDQGADSFGVVSTGYRFGLAESPFDVSAGIVYRWGLNAVDNGAPGFQDIAGAPFLADGAPQDHSLITAVTVGYRIGG